MFKNQLIDTSKQVQAKAFCSRLNLFCYFFTDLLFNLFYNSEYKRDREKGLAITLPCNYYPDDDPTQRPMLQWRSHGNILYANWLNYYVYQQTPYEFINTDEIIGK